MTFGQGLRKRRKETKRTQVWLKDAVNISTNGLISSYERDRTIPNVYLALDMAQALGCSIYDLLEQPNPGIQNERERIAELVLRMMYRGEGAQSIARAIVRGDQ